ncbi:MAG: hypothetical protein J6D54_08755 [Olsenella sp.]|nr:hypothetical protein [Olsenella sp.]
MWRKNLEEKIHRREWAQTDNPLVDEARAQTLAIQRLQVWLRLGYAVLAVAVLLAYWGFGEGGGVVAGVIGVALGVLTLAVVIVLRVGITHGRQNVNAMLEDIQSSVSSSKGSGTPDASNASNASGAASAATGTASK